MYFNLGCFVDQRKFVQYLNSVSSVFATVVVRQELWVKLAHFVTSRSRQNIGNAGVITENVKSWYRNHRHVCQAISANGFWKTLLTDGRYMQLDIYIGNTWNVYFCFVCINVFLPFFLNKFLYFSFYYCIKFLKIFAKKNLCTLYYFLWVALHSL